jgi:hypothetical protein
LVLQPVLRAVKEATRFVFPSGDPTLVVVYDELGRGLDSWNTFDTDNNEKKAGQQTQETAFFFVAAQFWFNGWAVFPP